MAKEYNSDVKKREAALSHGKRTVLIVEDNSLNREILTDILAPYYIIIEASDGKTGFDLMMEYGTRISLVLLDIQMPVMDGYEFLEALQEKKQFATIPIIVTTSADSTTNEIKCLENGASDFVSKPYDPDIILKRVESMIRLSEASAMLNKMEYDSVTGLYSKEFFYEYSTRLLENYPDTKFDIICSDIESFKMINDRYGTEKGDELLKALADCFTADLKPQEICGRISADVFAIMSIHDDSGENLKKFSDKDRFKDALPVPNVVIKYGVYENVSKNQKISMICDRAKMAISSIKYRYGEYYAVYDEDMHKKLVMEQRVLDNMETALREEQFTIYFQPKHCLKHDRTEGAEALVRWIHPEYGFMSPGEFIPMFERNGFISKLDSYILDKTCRYIRDWIDSGNEVVPISVNVSRIDFDMPDLDEQIGAIVDKYRVPHEMIHLEVTESAYTENPEQILNMVKKFRKKGFLVELDDFGAGYTSLNVLSEMELDVLKLDMSLVRKIELERQNIVITSVLKLAESLGMKTVAEGIETKEQAEELKRLGCTYVQGYYYARPMPIEQFEEYLRENG